VDPPETQRPGEPLKYVLLFLLIAFVGAILFPRSIPRFLRRAGRSVGDAGRLGREIATGEEADQSPLARYEARAGEIVALRLLSEHPLSADARLRDEVGAVGARLAAHAQRRQIHYRFQPLESDEPNAFAVPGGNIFITRPLVDLCGGDTGALAGVLAHEIIHIDQRHAVKNLAASAAARTGLQVLTLGRGAILGQIASGMKELLVQGYRQDQEIEADLFGVRLARLAGFDPAGLVRLLERLREPSPDGKGTLAELFQYFRSHPPVDERIARLRRELG